MSLAGNEARRLFQVPGVVLNAPERCDQRLRGNILRRGCQLELHHVVKCIGDTPEVEMHPAEKILAFGVKLVIGTMPKGIATVGQIVPELSARLQPFTEQTAHEKRVFADMSGNGCLPMPIRYTAFPPGISMPFRQEVDNTLQRPVMLIAEGVKRTGMRETRQHFAHVIDCSRFHKSVFTKTVLDLVPEELI